MNKIIKILFVLLLGFAGSVQSAFKQKIDNIILQGVRNLEEKQVFEVLRIHKAKFLSKMNFDRRLIKLDAINIKTLYVSKGYLGVSVKDSVDYKTDFVDVYFIVDEGKRYYVNKIAIIGNNIIDNEEILKILGLKSGRAYNPVKTKNRENKLEEIYKERGKLFSDIKITDSIEDSVEILIDIKEGSDVYINNIAYTGIGLIDSNIVKREMRIKKGDLYVQSSINQSQRQLLQTGIFSVANITPIRIENSVSLVNLLVELRLFRQFEWISEGGYYPIEYYEGADAEPGAGVLVEWKNRSLFNSATSLSTKLSGQTLITEQSFNPKIRFDVTIANPWLYKIKIPTKTQVYLESFKDYISVGSPYVTRYGIELVNTYYLDQMERRSYIETRLYLDRFSRKDYLDVGTLTDNTTEDQTIKVDKHTFEINFRLDKSDNVLYPTQGVVYSAQLAGTGGILGGNRDFIKLDLGLKGYERVLGDIIFAAQLKYGMITGWNEFYHDYLYDKFYLGGSNSLRGWDMLRYKVDGYNQPYGDIIRILNNYEIRFPLFWLLGGEIFIDGGHIYNSLKKIALNNFGWNGGFGITLSTPLGPIRLDAAKALTNVEGWKVQLGVQYIF